MCMQVVFGFGPTVSWDIWRASAMVSAWLRPMLYMEPAVGGGAGRVYRRAGVRILCQDVSDNRE